MFREELKGNVSIVRELHVYGSAIPVHSRSTSQFQHKGYGTLLMEEAERIAREEHFSDKIAVISGVGTRHYYRKLGYSLDGVYMSKMLNWIVCSNQNGTRCCVLSSVIFPLESFNSKETKSKEVKAIRYDLVRFYSILFYSIFFTSP